MGQLTMEERRKELEERTRKEAEERSRKFAAYSLGDTLRAEATKANTEAAADEPKDAHLNFMLDKATKEDLVLLAKGWNTTASDILLKLVKATVNQYRDVIEDQRSRSTQGIPEDFAATVIASEKP